MLCPIVPLNCTLVPLSWKNWAPPKTHSHYGVIQKETVQNDQWWLSLVLCENPTFCLLVLVTITTTLVLMHFMTYFIYVCYIVGNYTLRCAIKYRYTVWALLCLKSLKNSENKPKYKCLPLCILAWFVAGKGHYKLICDLDGSFVTINHWAWKPH